MIEHRARRVVGAPAEQRELDLRPGVQRPERPDAVGRHQVGDEQDRPAAQRQGVLVGGDRRLPAGLPRERALDRRPRERAERRAPARLREQLLDRAGQHLGVARRHEDHPVARARDLLGPRLAERPDGGHAAGHRLHVRDAERLVGRRQHEHVGVAHAGERLRVGQLAGELDLVGQPEILGEALERRALRAVADDDVAQRRQPVAQEPHRAQDVGVALAGDEVADASRASGPWAATMCPFGHVGAEAHDPRALGPHGAAHPLDARAVGQHEPRADESAARTALAPAVRARAGVEDVAAVDGDDERRGDPRPPHGLAGGHGVVGVDEVERERAPQPAQRDADRRRRVGAPGPVGARPRRRDERDVLDLQAVELRAPGLAQQLACGGRRGARAPRAACAAVGSGGAGRAPARRPLRLWRPSPGDAPRPPAPDRSPGDRTPRPRATLIGPARDQAASARVTYGRSARNARASATGASRA